MKTKNGQLTYLIGGAQGTGVDTAANIFSKACAYKGFFVFGKRELHSNIKGAHSYFTVQLSEKPVNSHHDGIDILVSFDAETLFRHFDKVVKNGAILYDEEQTEVEIDRLSVMEEITRNRIKEFLGREGRGFMVKDILDYAKIKGIKLYPIPYKELLKKLSKKLNKPEIAKWTMMFNVMAVSASFGLLNFDLKPLLRTIQETFGAKDKAEMNIDACNYVYEWVKEKHPEFLHNLKGQKFNSSLIMAQGTQAIALGKIAGGCKFQTYYPITPATDESVYLEANCSFALKNNGKGSIVVVQTEDEIAAITMAIGAGIAGARSATSTSGPGFSLMVEALSWAGANEVPVVVTLYQRGGPSTGLPTRHEQGDLLFAIHSGHGDFPKIVYSSGNIEESFYDTIRVFNYAEKYQLPVIHILDKALANSIITCEEFDPEKVKIDRGELTEKPSDEIYKRFKFTESGISPRVKLGTENAIFWNAGDEHTEEGHISEDPENRSKMMDKRLRKLKYALENIPDQEKLALFGDEDAELAVVSWGSTKGAIIDAMAQLSEEGIKIKFIQIKLLHPFPDKPVAEALKEVKTVVDIEMNQTAQLSSLIKQKTFRDIDYYILKYNGRPMSQDEVFSALKNITRGDAPQRQVLRYGD